MTLSLRQFAYFVALMIMFGWLLHVGKPVLLPVLIAMIALYILSNVTDRLGAMPLIGRLPATLRRFMVLAAFTVVLVLLVLYVAETFTQVATVLPRYDSNLDALATQLGLLMHLEDEPTWATVRAATIDQFQIQSYIGPILASVRGFGGTLFLVVLYAAFFMAERARMAEKLALAIGDPGRESRTLALLARINARVGNYLSVKTVVNVVLGAISFGILLLFGIDFALFWAILIGLLNYIPYIGSMIGGLFPILLSLAQFGSFPLAAAVASALTVAQLFVAGYLEPRMMSRAFNLSPFVVLFALAFWSALWGLPGAVLAVPLTASLIIVMAEIDATRPVAIMLSATGKV